MINTFVFKWKIFANLNLIYYYYLHSTVRDGYGKFKVIIFNRNANFERIFKMD